MAAGGPPPGGNYVWDPSRFQWVNAGPPPGPNWEFDPIARRWVPRGGPKVPQGGPGNAPNIPASSPGTPAQHIPAPPVSPFLNPDEQNALDQSLSSFERQLLDADFQLGMEQLQSDQSAADIDRNAKQASAQTTDEMIGRGLFQSSIRDTALYDIEGQRQIRQTQLRDRLAAVELYNRNLHANVEAAKSALQRNAASQAAQNAANKDPGPGTTIPGTPSTAPAPLSPGPPPSPNHVWNGQRWVPKGGSVSGGHGNFASGPPPSPNHYWDGRRWVKR